MGLQVNNLQFEREDEVIDFKCTSKYSYVARYHGLILYEIIPIDILTYKIKISNQWWYRNSLEDAIQSARNHWAQIILSYVKEVN